MVIPRAIENLFENNFVALNIYFFGAIPSKPDRTCTVRTGVVTRTVINVGRSLVTRPRSNVK